MRCMRWMIVLCTEAVHALGYTPQWPATRLLIYARAHVNACMRACMQSWCSCVRRTPMLSSIRASLILHACTRMRMRMRMRMRISMHTCRYVCSYAHKQHACACVRIRTHSYAFVHAPAHRPVCMHVRSMRTRMHTCAHADKHACMRMPTNA